MVSGGWLGLGIVCGAGSGVVPLLLSAWLIGDRGCSSAIGDGSSAIGDGSSAIGDGSSALGSSPREGC